MEDGGVYKIDTGALIGLLGEGRDTSGSLLRDEIAGSTLRTGVSSKF